MEDFKQTNKHCVISLVHGKITNGGRSHALSGDIILFERILKVVIALDDVLDEAVEDV